MKILVLNTGSSSVKYKVFETEQTSTDIGPAKLTMVNKGGVDKVTDHKQAIHDLLEAIGHIDAIGHRVVHGGEYFSKAVLIDESVKTKLKELIPLAPLHNPANIIGIEAAEKLLPGTPNIAVFDTAFHQSMAPTAYTYAIPYKYYETYKIRRYGFHGSSHKYVSHRAAEILGKKLEDLKLIVCHVGNGASMSAISHGKVVDTSMGFTPLEGLLMGTRSGDIDPAIIFFLMEQEGLSPNEMDTILNKQSGLLGVSELSSDMRDIIKAHHAGDTKATLAMDMYITRIIKYIGSYVAELNGCDAIVFSAGTLENSPFIRKLIADKLGRLGIRLDEEGNNFEGEERIISTNDSEKILMVVPTNEEYMIALETLEVFSMRHNIDS